MAKAIWNGSIAFGLVNIPVRMYSAVSENSLDLDMLDKSDHEPIRYKRVNQKTGKEVAWKDIVKGYDLNGNYIVLEDSDFEKAAAEKTKRIEIKSFVKQDEIDPIYFDKTYYLEPDKGSPHSYNLLRNAMVKTEMVGLGSYVLRNRENLCIIRVYQNALVLTKVHFEQDIRSLDDLNIPSAEAKQNAEELKMAVSLIKNMQTEFDISKRKDEYTEQLLNFIQEKAKGKTPKPQKSKSVPKEVTTLMEQLKASLNQPVASKKTPQKRTNTKKASSKKKEKA